MKNDFLFQTNGHLLFKIIKKNKRRTMLNRISPLIVCLCFFENFKDKILFFVCVVV